MTARQARVLPGRASAEEVARVVCEAFAEYPVMRYVLGDHVNYAARLRVLIGFFHFGSMRHELATRNIRLFAEKVLPELKRG